MSADVPRLLGHPRRLAIACAALDAPLTIGEIADRLDTKDGAIRTMVDFLAREELLVRSDRPGRRARTTAAAYQVNAAHSAAVREHCDDASAPMLEENQEVLLVPLAGLAEAARTLAQTRPAAIAWGVRTRDPQLSLMLGLRHDSTPQERDALLLALRDAGVDCARLHVGEPFVPAALFEYATGIASTGGQLPRGG